MLDSGFSDFFRQLPPILIVMFCGSSIALVAVLAVIVNTRGRKARGVESASAAAAPAFSSPAAFDLPGSGDLPDLDDLLTVQSPDRAPRPVIHGASTLRTTAGETVDVIEVLAILRDTEAGGLLIRMGDQLHRHPPALADAEFKRQFNNTIRDLYQSIGDTALNKRATGETAAASAEAASEPAKAAPPPAVPPSAAMPGDLPKFKMPDVIEKPKRGRKTPKEAIPEINIASAIEEYLQFKLSSAPQFAGRAIHVRPAVGGGLRIDVDDQSYETVGEVEDQAVRAFLQSAIDEWQSRQ